MTFLVWDDTDEPERRAEGSYCLTMLKGEDTEATCGSRPLIESIVAHAVLPDVEVPVEFTSADGVACAEWEVRGGTEEACGPSAFLSAALRESSRGVEAEDARREAAGDRWQNGAKGACVVHNVAVVAGANVATTWVLGWVADLAALKALEAAGLSATARGVLSKGLHTLSLTWAFITGLSSLTVPASLGAFEAEYTEWEPFARALRHLGATEHYLSRLSRKLGVAEGEFSILCGGQVLGD